MIKSKGLVTQSGQEIHIMYEGGDMSLEEILKTNRSITDISFFSPSLEELHDPYLMPDMEKAVERIIKAKELQERIVIFGDYDVDGVSSTAILVRFLTDIGCSVSYRLPHRVHDGYGLKEYFFDELAEKNVKLVITVDCGTRDIGPIKHAKSLGIDVIVTDHHAVPDIIPEEVIALLNPKRKDSAYPFRDLAGAGVAFKLVHALAIAIEDTCSHTNTVEKNTNVSSVCVSVSSILTSYIDFAALGTVSDCMPITGENRIITALGLKQMMGSRSHGLRKFLAGREKIRENDADLIGFQIGPRINAAGRMDTPITALQWLLAGEAKTDALFEELDHLNDTRKGTTDHHFEKALANIDTSKPILFYDAHDLEHGVIGLVAGKLTEMYGKPSIVLKNGHDHPLTSRKGDEVIVTNDPTDNGQLTTDNGSLSIASCRSPEWCNMIELLESCREYFIRFGGHRQAAGFTIETSKIDGLKDALYQKMAEIHDIQNLPKKTIHIECTLDAMKDLTITTIDTIDRFRPFGIGNRKPLFLLRDVTILESSPLGKEGKHLQLRIMENPKIKLIMWNPGEEMLTSLETGNIVSLIVELDRNEWNGKESVSVIVKDIVSEKVENSQEGR